MKIKIPFLIFVTAPLISIASDKPINPVGATRLGDGFSVESREICYMENVYLIIEREGKIESTSLIWNHNENRPYKCKEYKEYRDAKVSKYKIELESYYKENP
jgi:hypothetical protein